MNRTNQSGNDSASGLNAIARALRDLAEVMAAAFTIEEGSFTGTLTGMDASTTGTVSYRVTANAAGTGKICRLYVAANILGTSNTTAMTMTGLPAACVPSVAVDVVCVVADNSSSGVLGQAKIDASGTTITFATDLPFSTTGFTGSNIKGLNLGWQIEYAL